MRLLGIDYGEKRVGVALSDESAKFAFARGVILNTGHEKVIKEIKKICDENNISKIILGKSLNYKGEPNPIMKKIELFKKQLEGAINLKVIYENEILTTMEAKRPLCGEKAQRPVANKKKRDKSAGKLVDASAAAIILKSFLDKKMLE